MKQLIKNFASAVDLAIENGCIGITKGITGCTIFIFPYLFDWDKASQIADKMKEMGIKNIVRNEEYNGLFYLIIKTTSPTCPYFFKDEFIEFEGFKENGVKLS